MDDEGSYSLGPLVWEIYILHANINVPSTSAILAGFHDTRGISRESGNEVYFTSHQVCYTAHQKNWAGIPSDRWIMIVRWEKTPTYPPNTNSARYERPHFNGTSPILFTQIIVTPNIRASSHLLTSLRNNIWTVNIIIVMIITRRLCELIYCRSKPGGLFLNQNTWLCTWLDFGDQKGNKSRGKGKCTALWVFTFFPKIYKGRTRLFNTVWDYVDQINIDCSKQQQ